jgi:hypothetical protein
MRATPRSQGRPGPISAASAAPTETSEGAGAVLGVPVSTTIWWKERRDHMGRQQFHYLWWILDPTHMRHCTDCKRMAARSPYEAPGTGSNELFQAPGDRRTLCGADCTCILSYTPPGAGNLDVAQALSPSPRSFLRNLLKHCTHGQVWYLQTHNDLWRRVAATQDRSQ